MQFHIILVSPARPENIGAVARAMKTMGFSSLRIVNSEAHLLPQARWVAHGATDILDNSCTFSTLAQAIKDIDFVVASTARHRSDYHYYCTPPQLLTLLEEKKQWMNNVALVFGPENSGLSNEQLALTDLLTSVELAADYPSLNLAQSVMVYCYQLTSLVRSPATPFPSDHSQLRALRQRFHDLLIKLDVVNDKKLANWFVQRSSFLAQRDTAMLHRLLHDIEKKIQKNK